MEERRRMRKPKLMSHGAYPDRRSWADGTWSQGSQSLTILKLPGKWDSQHQGPEINWQSQPVLPGPYYRFLVMKHWLPVPYEKPWRPKPVYALRADEFSQLRSDRRVMEGGWFQWRSVNKWAGWIVSDGQRRKDILFLDRFWHLRPSEFRESS